MVEISGVIEAIVPSGSKKMFEKMKAVPLDKDGNYTAPHVKASVNIAACAGIYSRM